MQRLASLLMGIGHAVAAHGGNSRVQFRLILAACCAAVVAVPLQAGEKTQTERPADHIRELQAAAVAEGRADWGHWGADPEKYSSWTTHSNRLIPIYTFGLSLEEVQGPKSLYRDPARIEALYGRLPEGTHNPSADYFDQTDVYRLQEAAVAAGKKQIVLVVFDGMDWQTTQAAVIHKLQQVAYGHGRGTGLKFQDYRAPVNDFGLFVTSPHNDGTTCDVDAQAVTLLGGLTPGGYDPRQGGATAWDAPSDPLYLLGRSPSRRHAVTDSASSATSLTSGIKTYNDAINVDWQGRQVVPIARRLQDHGWAVGVVTSVPISHATPACAYANNVHRDDYQDLTRDLLGLRSVAHRGAPLPGVDVLLGAGWGEQVERDPAQGQNFIPGNKYLASSDREAIDAAHGGKYLVVERTPGASGTELLAQAARKAADEGLRLFGFFGAAKGHLPFRTADGGYDPVPGVRPAEQYSQADIRENPTLADMTRAALEVLGRNERGFWLMVEAGDVDWANHDNNLDNSIGAVLSGDDAFAAVVEWVEARDAWDDTAVMVTADHGHYLVLEKPEALVAPK